MQEKAVARRGFEMFQYRQVLVRMRQGDPDRAIARSGLMGRRKLAAFGALCECRLSDLNHELSAGAQ